MLLVHICHTYLHNIKQKLDKIIFLHHFSLFISKLVTKRNILIILFDKMFAD